MIKKSEKEDISYELQVLEQVKHLDVVIEKIKNFKHVDISNIFILGSSMVGATAVTSSVIHSDDIKGLILQYPSINLNPQTEVDGAQFDINKYKIKVLIFQGTSYRSCSF